MKLCGMLLLRFLDPGVLLNQIFDDINLYNRIAEINSKKNKNVNIELEKNSIGKNKTRLFIENK